jgi:hypothetical protein
MTEEKKKTFENDQETIKPTRGKEDELTEKDLEKASGGHFPKVDIVTQD